MKPPDTGMRPGASGKVSNQQKAHGSYTDFSASPQVVQLAITIIKDGGAQMRVEMSESIIEEYAEAMLAGDVFPPIIVFSDGTDHWLADGFHRARAAKMLGRESIDADVRQGTQRDALLYGIGSNAEHGLRRTQADKRKAITALLADDEWSKWSDRKIAKSAGCDHKTVGKIRRDRLRHDFELIEEEYRECEKPADETWSRITEEMEPLIPEVSPDDLPKAEPEGDPDEPALFDSKRDYLTQIDHYRDWQRR